MPQHKLVQTGGSPIGIFQQPDTKLLPSLDGLDGLDEA